MNSSLTENDAANKALKLYEDSQREFQNHWVWQELGIKPKDFFKALNIYIQKIGISEDEWKNKYEYTKKIHRTLALEKINPRKKPSLPPGIAMKI